MTMFQMNNCCTGCGKKLLVNTPHKKFIKESGYFCYECLYGYEKWSWFWPPSWFSFCKYVNN